MKHLRIGLNTIYRHSAVLTHPGDIATVSLLCEPILLNG